MTNFQRTAKWLHACGKGKTVDNASVQIGCHFEEVVEFIHALSFSGEMSCSPAAFALMTETLDSLADDLKRRQVQAHVPPPCREAVLDSLCDQNVTLDGVAYLLDFDKDGADEAVLEANDDKLVDGKPVILEGGKIGKPQGWQPADISRFV